MFVDRRQELDFLNSLLTRSRPGPAQLVLMYGRSRVGKSELLMQWAAQSGLPSPLWALARGSLPIENGEEETFSGFSRSFSNL